MRGAGKGAGNRHAAGAARRSREMRKASSLLPRLAAALIAAACAAGLPSCDNLSGITEWPAHIAGGGAGADGPPGGGGNGMAQMFAVVYHGNDPSASMQSFTHMAGAYHTVMGNLFGLLGFDGWERLSSVIVYQEGDAVTAAAGDTIHFFAIWYYADVYGPPLESTVIFDGNEETGGDQPPQISEIPGTLIVLPGAGSLVRAGYRFDGWNTEPDGSGTHFDPGYSFALDRDITLYAQWAPLLVPNVRVAFDGNGHTGGTVPGPIYAPSGTIIYLPSGNLVRDGHWFEGWNTQADGSGDFFLAYNDDFTVTGNVTLFAHWVPLPIPSFHVTFHGNGYDGSTLPGPMLIYRDQQLYLPQWYADREIGDYWFAFLGWSTNPDSAVPEYPPGGAFTGRDNDVTLYATWAEYGFAFDGGAVTGFSGGSADIVIPSVINAAAVTSIGSNAFEGMELTSVGMPPGVASIGNNAFSGNLLASVYIPAGVGTVGYQAFSLNPTLASLTIASHSTVISTAAFLHAPLVSITIPAGMDNLPGPYTIYHSMGMHGADFLEFYNGTGMRAGTYLWIEAESRWILEGDGGDAAFRLDFAGFTDAAPGVDADADQSVSVVQSPAYINITATGASFDEIRWIHNGAIVPGASEATLDFSDLHRGQIGAHFVTIEARIGGRWYSRVIRISVTM